MNEINKLKTVRNIVIVAGVFCSVVALLLLLNFLQVSQSDPVESKVIDSMVERLKDDPNNDTIIEEIRTYDLLVRKAYFNSQWQVKTGSYILLFGAFILGISLISYYTLKAKIEKPEILEENEFIARVFSQKWLFIVGFVILATALVASAFTVDYLDKFDVAAINSTTEEDSDNSSIEVIEVGKKTEIPQTTTNLEGNAAETISDENVVAENIDPNEPVEESKIVPVEKSPAPVSASASETEIFANSGGFRGPFGNGVSRYKNIPVSFDGAAGSNTLWKTKIPKHGYSSPVIWGNKLFLTGADAQVREVYCFDKNSGKLLWSKPADNITGSPVQPPRVTEDTGLAASTVSTNGKQIVAIFATGDIIAFDMDGNRLWARNLGVPDNHYGHSSSLINWENRVFVQYDTNKGGKLLALNILSGETEWETVRSSKISWASPILITVDGKKQLILSADPTVAAYDVETGEELWATECMMGEVGPSAAYFDGFIFASNEYARLVALDAKTGEIKWEDDEYLPEVASPVAANGLLFIATSYGVFACYDAKTGDKLWEQEFGNGFYASPVIAGNKIYALDTDGEVHIMEVSREAKIIGTAQLGEEGYTTPAFSDGRIYIRGLNQLYCFGEK